jgi:gliding motility-associated-like protein
MIINSFLYSSNFKELGRKSIVVLLFLFFIIGISFSQNSPNPINGVGPYTNMLNCTGTPTYSVDLTGNPAGTWTSNPQIRAGSCCVPPDNNCVQFTVILDPAAEGIIFSIPGGCGAAPSGSLFYQVNCGPLTSVGSPLCLNGTGPFIITFCKPGGNANCYSITSIPAPATGGDIVTADGCKDTLTVTGVTAASTTWTSISPGTPGQYNNYLNNLTNTQPGVSGTPYSGQTSVVVTPQVGFPSVIQYKVCGTVIGGCSAATFCDTVSVSIFPSLFAQINPLNPSICFGSPGTTLTAVPIGGTAPFTYLWTGPSNNGATTSSILASVPGVYTLSITDATGCPAASTTVTVTQFANPITVNAGPDITVCKSPIPTIAITGSVTGVTTGIWSGGSGTYSPSNTSLALNYTPSAAELAAGTVTLTLTSTNNGSCPAASDQVTITLPQFTSTLSTVPTNITCNGLLNGAIDLTVTGGFATSGYLWASGQTTQDISGLAPGTYSVTVTDVNGCKGVATQTITQPAVLVSAITAQTNVSCFGGNNGSVTVAGAGGTTAYQYSLNGGPNQASGTFSGLIAGSYTITITDAHGCTVNQAVTITQPLAALAVTTTQTNILCFGTLSGAINLTPTGGTTPYTFSWSNGATTEDLSSIPAGTYTVVVTDANGSTGGCTATTTVTITQPAAPLTLSSTQVNVLCFGGSTGSINLTPAGGTAPYTFSWSNGATTEDLSGLAAGTYTVNVHDANGLAGSCAATATITITQPAAPLTVTSTKVNVLCFGGSTGSIDLTPAGGTPAYTYAWSNGATTQDLSGLAAGTYTVVVTDANGSTGGCTATTTVTITQPAAALTVSTTQTNVLCFGASTGAINLTPAGGTAPYTYSWSNGATTEDLSSIPAGTYTVVVTDANGSTGGCTATTTVTITQPAAPLTLSSTQVNVLCFGGSTGSINLTPAGGTAPYTFSWSNGATTEDLSGLAAGTYTVNVHDANGLAGSCAATATITITQPAAPLTVTSTKVNVLCFGGSTGSIDLTPAGGTPAYTYAWSNGATTQDLSGLAAGTYTVVVTDANGSTGGCTATTTVTITQPAAALTVTSTQTNVLCNGSLTGAINITPAGGTAPYSFAWSNGASTEDITGLAAGTYTVVVTDANGSTGGCTATTTATITQPAAPLTLTFTQTNVLCNGSSTGSIDLTPAGGTAPYTYSWSNGATTQDISSLAAGTYTVNVNDANGLVAGCAATATITITQPTALTQTISAFTYPSGTNISCFGLTDGSVNLTIGGGVGPYSYSWSNGSLTEDLTNVGVGTYTVNVTDANGCIITSTITLTQPLLLTSSTTAVVYAGGYNTTGCLSNGTIDLTVAGGNPGYSYSWSNGSTTQDISSLPAGTYNVTVTDLNGCQTTSAITLTQPNPLAQSITAFTYPSGTNISCFGLSDGSVDLSITGGTPNYSYTWSNGATTQDLANVPFGTYNVTVTDANGCQITSTITLTQPTLLTSAVVPSLYAGGFNVSGCVPDGSIDLTVAGGNPGYTYSWSNGATTQDVNTLIAGNYIVTVTDVNGCQSSNSITLTQPSTLSQTITATTFPSGTNISCFGLSDGNIDLTIGGGTPGYTYVWTTGATTQDLTNMPAGTYGVIVMDANGCQISSSITLTQPPALTQTITAAIYQSGTNISCFGLSDGSVDLTITGGNPAYTYTWSNGAITQDLTNVPAGAYNITVTDVNGCTIASNINLIQPTVLTQAISATTFPSGTNISCFGLSDGNIDLTVGGGNPGYTYSWSNGAISQDLSNLPAGTYNVTVTDVNGCTIPSTITLTQPAVLTQAITSPTFPSGTNISCFGLTDGSVDLTIGGGNPGYTYSWSNGSTTQDLSTIGAGTYSVTVTDVNGCTIPSTITLTQPTLLTQSITAATYPSGTNISCFGLSDGSIDLSIAGGNPGYTYTWSNGATTQDLSGLVAGTYNVTVTDINGCSIPSTITLIQPTLLTSGVVPSLYPGGFNVSGCLLDGSIDLTVAGGNPGYSYVWSNGSNNQDISTLPAGTYTVTVTDLNGCQTTNTITLTQPIGMTQTISAFTYPSGTNISCFGLSDGSINLTIGGGVASYTYAWSNGAATEDLTNLPAGTYNVTVTDQNGCQIESSITLTQPTALTQEVTAFTYPSGTNISCFGLSDGSVDLTTGGGSPGYTYLWSNGATTQDIASLPVGTYTVVVTDLNGCTIPSTITLIQPTALTQGVTAFTYPSGTNISCFGLSDGSVDLTIGGGNPGYNYLWSNGATTQDLSMIPVGTYSVVATDINGCTIPSTITLTEPTILTQTVTSPLFPSGTNISCFGMNDGSIDLTIGGGNPGYTYNWSTGATTQDLSTLIAGTYSVTVTDINGCTIPSTITLTEPTPIAQGITAATYPSGTNISCFGLSDGSIDLTINGGNPTYTYLWSNGATTQDISGLPAGTYSVTVTDINGCTIPSAITLVQPTALTESSIAFTYPSGNNISCFGFSDGSVNLSIGGGSPGYTYLWNTGSTLEDISALPAGTYTVTTTDINGCTINSSITLDQPTALTQTVSAFTYPSGTNISCFGLSDGTIDLTVNNGSPGYTYSWSNGATTQDLSSVPAGTYNVVITDLNGCILPSTITLVEPPVLTQGVTAFIYPSGSNISCFGLSDGSIDLTIGGGNPGYTYLWNTGAVSQDLSSMPAGNYTVLVTDINGCTIPSAITLTEPTILTQTTTSPTFIGGNNISCFGLSDGSIDFSVGGGSPGYTYSWSTGATTEDLASLPIGTYNVTATDVNGCQINGSITLTEPTPFAYSETLSIYSGGFNVTGCNADGTIDLTVSGSIPGYIYSWSNGAPTQDVSALAAGTYTVTITDANGCQLIVDTTLVAAPVVNVTTQVVSNYNGQDISCYGYSDGSVTSNPSGGVPGYTFQWSDATNVPISSNQTPIGLPSGLYNVVVTDQNGCTATTTVTLVDPPAYNFNIVVSTNYNGQDISCFGASDGGIDLTVSGATPGYSYHWTDATGTSFSAIQDPNGLPAGTYDIQTTDLNGCTFTASITLTEPPLLMGVADVISDYNGSDVSCFGSTDGSLTVVPSGGTPTYSYEWFNSSGTSLGTNVNQGNVGAGIYQVVITDVNGCDVTAPVVVTEPNQLISAPIIISNYFGQAVSCEGATDGIVQIYTAGGVPTYSYEWNTSPIITTQIVTTLGVGDYDITVTDLNGCTSISTVSLTANPLPVFELPPAVFGCIGNSVTLNSNAAPGSSCTWVFSDGQVFNDCGPFEVNFSGQDCYDLQYSISNLQGCTSTASMTNFVCIQPNPVAGFYADDYEITNVNSSTNFWNTSTGAISYMWNFGDGTPVEFNVNESHLFTYSNETETTSFEVILYAISEYGCIDSTIRYINMNPEILIYVPNTFTPDNDEYNNDFHPVISSGVSEQGYTLLIFNRWGELIFESHDYNFGWDGTYGGELMQDGTYTWKITVKDIVTDKKQVFVGHVNLIR